MVLTREDNELLCRVGPGTPMGEVFRRYWIPALLSEELPQAGGPPVTLSLLGEKLIGFRDSEGSVGLLAELCSHRQASLFYGRPEAGGLRCIYHGWKYAVDGKILDTPCERPETMTKYMLRHPAYPCREVNGIIWTYMGPAEKMPQLPNTLWFNLPEDHLEIVKFKNECNYLQALEGDCDHPHSAFLHRRGEGLQLSFDPTAMQFEECEQTWWGVRAVMATPRDDGEKTIRSNLFIYPFVGAIPGGGGQAVREGRDGIHVIYQVPADDYTTTRYDIAAHRHKPRQRTYRLDYMKELNPDFTKVANKSNGYLMDREAQQTRVFAGIPFGNHTQDACVTESMGPIMDRTKEHLGDSDGHVAAVRQALLRALAAVQKGDDPPGVAFTEEQSEGFKDLWCTGGVVPMETSWRALLADLPPITADETP